MILATLFRFLILALPLVLLTLGVFHFAAEAADLAMPGTLPAPQLLGRWLLEATGLVALYLLVRERGLGRWLAGLASGWVAWIFRGPVLVLTVAGAARLSSSSWWHLSAAWLGLYTICGLMMASVARSLEGSEAPEVAGRAEEDLTVGETTGGATARDLGARGAPEESGEDDTGSEQMEPTDQTDRTDQTGGSEP